eukprot:sb/3467441/
MTTVTMLPWLVCLVAMVTASGHYRVPRESSNLTHPTLRIAHGDNANSGEFPFVGLLIQVTGFTELNLYQSMCGGSIISNRMILTAAHCVIKSTLVDLSGTEKVDEIFHPRNLQFHAGETNLFTDENTEAIYNIVGVIVHEDYDGNTITNDIAMLITQEEIQMSSNVSPIALPTSSDSSMYDVGSPVTVIGWGTTEDGETTHLLQKLEYSFPGMEACKAAYAAGMIEDGMVCTGEKPMTEEHSGTGDSGGPLFTKKDGDWMQLALVSWGPESQTHSSFDVNTDVLYYKDWISTHMDA